MDVKAKDNIGDCPKKSKSVLVGAWGISLGNVSFFSLIVITLILKLIAY